MLEDPRYKAYKFVTFSAITFSVVAVLSVCVTLPMVHNYVRSVRAQMRNEMDSCKASFRVLFGFTLTSPPLIGRASRWYIMGFLFVLGLW